MYVVVGWVDELVPSVSDCDFGAACDSSVVVG